VMHEGAIVTFSANECHYPLYCLVTEAFGGPTITSSSAKLYASKPPKQAMHTSTRIDGSYDVLISHVRCLGQ